MVLGREGACTMSSPNDSEASKCSQFYNMILLQAQLASKTVMFTGGRLRNFLPTWKELTSDSKILQILGSQIAEVEFAELELPLSLIHI